MKYIQSEIYAKFIIHLPLFGWRKYMQNFV